MLSLLVHHNQQNDSSQEMYTLKPTTDSATVAMALKGFYLFVNFDYKYITLFKE